MTLNCNGSLIDLTTPRIMGILNLTPDSFYDGGTLADERALLMRAETMLKEGATFLDVGGYSSRPGAANVSEEEELRRVIPAIAHLVKEFPEALLSVDTFRSNVAKESVALGAAMINDISGGDFDEEMFATVAGLNVPYILMHMRGTPQTMIELSNYKNVTTEVVYELSKKLSNLRSLGVNDVVIDPGFGFAKNIAQNFELMHHLEQLQLLDAPILVGISRKSMIYKTLGTDPEEALNGSTILNTVALMKGANILRVHDVKEAMECIQLLENLKK